jgi:hypothetical protein
MKVLFLQCSNDEAVVHSILYTKPNWSFYFRITSSKMICSIYFILSIKFKDQSSDIIATIVKDGATTFQVIDSLVTFTSRILRLIITVNIQYKTNCCFTLSLDISSLISVNSDSNLKRFDQNNTEQDEDMHFEVRIAFKIIILAHKDLDHSWSSCRNFNEVKHAFHQLDNDDKSRVLLDEPIVWSVTQLVVITMDQLLTDPGTQQQPL